MKHAMSFSKKNFLSENHIICSFYTKILAELNTTILGNNNISNITRSRYFLVLDRSDTRSRSRERNEKITFYGVTFDKEL